MPRKRNIAVLMGGMSSEHEVSLNTGKNVIKYLDKDKYIIKPIIINKNGKWTLDGQGTTAERALKGADVVFNGLHGEYGEDGRIQGLLDCFNIPYTGSGVLASAIGMNKVISRKLFKSRGLKIPKAVIIQNTSRDLQQNFKPLGKKLVIKPSCLGSSVGITIVDCENKKAFRQAIKKACQKCNKVIVEEYIQGLEVTCGILDPGLGNKNEILVLPVTEIIPPSGKFFDYKVKYNGSTQEITPARISKKLSKTIQDQAIKAHQALECQGYSRIDFILKNKTIPYILEVNTLPGLTSESLLPKAAKQAGIEFSELLDIIIDNASGPVV